MPWLIDVAILSARSGPDILGRCLTIEGEAHWPWEKGLYYNTEDAAALKQHAYDAYERDLTSAWTRDRNGDEDDRGTEQSFSDAETVKQQAYDAYEAELTTAWRRSND
jgi:hypothetical protein